MSTRHSNLLNLNFMSINLKIAIRGLIATSLLGICGVQPSYASAPTSISHQTKLLSPSFPDAGTVLESNENKVPIERNVQIRVLDKKTQEPVVGVVLKTGGKVYYTDLDGYCTIPSVRSSKLVLSLRAIGFDEIVSQIYTLRATGKLIVHMTPSIENLGAVYVEAQRKHTTQLQQAVAIDTKTLEKSPALSLAQLLEKVPGVSSISSGSTISKPVIQGMHSSRILLVNNGVRLESQSWGADHAPEIDHTGASVVEVIKGAEAIRYGYGAVGGVVLFNQAPLPYGAKRPLVKGRMNAGYATNGHGYDGAGSLEMVYKRVGMRLHGMYQKAGDYSTAEYILNNTGYNNISYSGLLGYSDPRVTATLYSSLYYSRSGVYYASNISDIDQLLARFLAGRPNPDTFHPFSYDIKPPFQQTQHFTVKGDLKWQFLKGHNLEFKLSYQDNLRQEFENRKVDKISWIPVQNLQLTTYSAEGVWDANWTSNMSSQVGLSAMYQYNFNVPNTKQPAFIPNYAALTTGFFLLHKLRWGKLQGSAGMRYDYRALDVDGYTSLSSFKYYSDFRLYSNFTGSIAAHYQITDNIDARANIGWAWRPPDINELYATGLHHGTYWVVGNKYLKSERGYKAVMGARYRNTYLLIEPSLFYQHVENYIYDNIGKGLDRFHNHPSGKYPKFIYEQDNARFVGGDLSATFIPLDGLSITGKGEWINARNLTQNAWLPFMPSDRYTLGLSYDRNFGYKDRWHFLCSLEGVYVTKQTRFDPEKDLVPDSPDAYTLLNASAELGTTLRSGTRVKFMLLGDNVLNGLYKEYTDRFRYYAHSRGAQLTLRTIINF